MLISSQNFIILKKVDSTNNYAMALIEKGEAVHGTAVFALEQTAGRGRFGKKWESSIDKNIILSIIAQMQWQQLYQQFQLSVVTALACREFLLNFIKEDIKIKWPNDIYINDRKAGGILIENLIKGNLWQWAVIGIGLNINEAGFAEKDFKAVSLQQITGVQYDVVELARELHNGVIAQIARLKNEAFATVLDEYNDNLFCRGRKVKLKKDSVVFETTIEKVSPTGELITKDVIERKFVFDEVQWISFQ